VYSTLALEGVWVIGSCVACTVDRAFLNNIRINTKTTKVLIKEKLLIAAERDLATWNVRGLVHKMKVENEWKEKEEM
jgi:hypothetical protein